MNSVNKWRQWRLAIVVNLGAAVVAALAFGAWRSQSSEASAKAANPGGRFYEAADDVGYVPKANAEMTARSEIDGRVIYDVTYNTGPDHFRVVPQAAHDAEACVLVFGDSFTFGTGVGNDETFAAQIVKQSGGKVAAHNFGVAGWGPHQFLAGLQSGRFQRAIRCKPTDAVFLMIPSLIWRTVGMTNHWDSKGPRYRLRADGRPARDGALGDDDPYNWRRWIGLTPVSSKEAIARTVAVAVEAMEELKRHYPGIRTHFISYRVASWDDTDLSDEDLTLFEYRLHQRGINALPMEGIIPRFRFEARDYILSDADTHPNARAHRLIAEFILREMKAQP
jgi:hypothetical protein